MTIELEELLSDRSKKEKEYENIRKSNMLALLFEANISELEKLRKVNSGLTITTENLQRSLQIIGEKNEKLVSENQKLASELANFSNENVELKQNMQTVNDNFNKIKSENDAFKNSAAALNAVKIENEKLKSRLKSIRDKTIPLIDEIKSDEGK